MFFFVFFFNPILQTSCADSIISYHLVVLPSRKWLQVNLMHYSKSKRISLIILCSFFPPLIIRMMLDTSVLLSSADSDTILTVFLIWKELCTKFSLLTFRKNTFLCLPRTLLGASLPWHRVSKQKNWGEPTSHDNTPREIGSLNCNLQENKAISTKQKIHQDGQPSCFWHCPKNGDGCFILSFEDVQEAGLLCCPCSIKPQHLAVRFCI